TEMCVLTLYANCITYPYARRVRGPGTQNLNTLDLGPYHLQLKAFVRNLIDDPDLVLGDHASYRTATLDKQEMYRPCAYTAVLSLRKQLPQLRNLFVAFMTGALVVWERFTSEFVEGGEIDQLGDEDRKEIFIPATNDTNESGLGTKVASQRRCPNETLHQFNARFTFERNHTADFMRNCFIEEDQKYLRQRARELLDSLPQRSLRRAQVMHSEKKAAEHEEKAKRGAAAQADRQRTLESINLVLNPAEIHSLRATEMKKQTDVWRHVRRAPDMPAEKNMTTKVLKKAELLRLVARYPVGFVPEAERTPLKESEQKVGHPIGPVVTDLRMVSDGFVGPVGLVGGGQPDADPHYNSDYEDS
ncbi:hypothetical protein HDZ31DRAFT_45487, partial [Schizophyllum fasciatum]